jgi:hypothetical protein
MNNDYMLRLAESIGRAAAKIFLNKEEKEECNIDIESISGKDILPILLKKLVLAGKYNEAENILFDELSKNPSMDLINIGSNFYDMLLLKSDEELSEGNFSKEEIFQGLEDIKRITRN